MSVVVASQFDDDFNAALREHPARPTVVSVPADQPWLAASDADVLLVRPSSAWSDRVDAPEVWPGRIRWIFSGSVGIDRYPSWLLSAPQVSCSRGIFSNEIAHYVIAAIYAREKNLSAVQARGPADWRADKAFGSVAGRKIGIIGLGDIGAAVARLGLALGAEVAAVRRRPLASPVPGVRLLDSIADVVALADHIVLSLPATAATHKLIDASLLACAKPSAHLINIARGSVLDQDALIAVLDAGRLSFATLDVTDPEPLPAGHPLWTHPGVLLTPHISPNYSIVRQAHLEKILVNFDRFMRGETPHDLVDPAAGY